MRDAFEQFGLYKGICCQESVLGIILFLAKIGGYFISQTSDELFYRRF
jgi:hypothetical protein